MDLLCTRGVAMARVVWVDPGIQTLGDRRRIGDGNELLLRLVRDRRSGENPGQPEDGQANGDDSPLRPSRAPR